MSKFGFLLLAVLAAIFAAACGTVATPEWAEEALGTQAALLATDEHLTAIAPTSTPTSVPPTATSVPPTATLIPPTVPPTETPAPTATDVPTEEAAAQTAAVPNGDPANGQVLFTTMNTTASGNWQCSMCHSVTPDEMRLIGPGLWNVSVRGETRVEGQTALEYIHNSILHPNDFLAPADPAFPANLMPQNYAEIFSEEQISDIISYLFTLRDEPAAQGTSETVAEAAPTAETAPEAVAVPGVTGDPVHGQVVFTTMFTTANGNWMCSLCHSITPDEMRLVGPGLWNVSVRSETRIEGQTALEYIQNSILHPNDFIVPSSPAYAAGLMPQNWGEVLTEEQLNDVIAYLFTLHG